jgi:hypothetical protein
LASWHLGILAVALVQEKTILGLQYLFDVPGKEIFIGRAKIIKPGGWILTSSRNSEANDIKYFGFIPNLIKKNKQFPGGKYLSFRDTGYPRSSITIVEMSKEAQDKLRNNFPEKVRFADEGCHPLERNFNGFRAIECASAKSQVIFVPELALSLTLVEGKPEQLDKLEIRQIAGTPR